MDRERSARDLTTVGHQLSGSPVDTGTPVRRKLKFDRLRRRATWFGRAVLDTVLPSRCPVTGEIVDRPGTLSGRGWAQLQFIADPQCVCCGYPFEYDPNPTAAEATALCGACTRKAPVYDQARAALAYNDTCAQLLLRFKYGDRTDSVDQFARWMMHAGGPLWRDADAVVPVPLHYTRLVKRRFNQSAVLGRKLSEMTGVSFEAALLKRTRATRQQKGLGHQARRRNVQGAFAIDPHRSLTGLKFVLVDDVLTTGATVEACARLLKRHGAEKVSVLTVARVVSEQKIPI